MCIYACICICFFFCSPATINVVRITRANNTMFRITKTRCKLMQPCSETIYSATWVPCSGLMQSSLRTIPLEYFDEPSVYMLYVAAMLPVVFVPDEVSLLPWPIPCPC